MTVTEIRETAGPICRRYGVRQLDLFGSRARGESTPGSDVDLCVVFDDIPPSEYAKRFFGLLHDLEDALHAPVDLLTRRSVRRPSLRRNLERDGVRIYG